jgi:hypothetical protein
VNRGNEPWMLLLASSSTCNEPLVMISRGNTPLRLLLVSTSLLRPVMLTSSTGIGPVHSIHCVSACVHTGQAVDARTCELVVGEVDGQEAVEK